jgi:hypothetical protein
MELFHWPITSIFGTWGTPSTYTFNYASFPQIQACFVIPPLNPYFYKLLFIHGSWTWPNNMGWKGGAIGNILGHTLKTWGTHWEPVGNSLGNLMGTQWEHIGNRPKSKKSHPILLPPKTQQKNWAFLSLLIGCMKFAFPKWFITIEGTYQP